MVRILKGFIEVTERYDGMRLLLPVSGIRAVAQDDNGSALIEFESAVNRKGSVFNTSESYGEVKKKIQDEV